eukprot:2700411-Amphidinium_carterae.1
MAEALLQDRSRGNHFCGNASSEELVFHMKQLWDAFVSGEQPKWRSVQERPRDYDDWLMASGKY